jgi:hypothetical protein
MNNKVIVVPNKNTGEILTFRTITDKSTGEQREVGVVMVQSKTLSGLSALARVATRTAFITLEEGAIEFLGDSLIANQPFPMEGKICIEETLTPYIRKNGEPQEAKINPTTKDVITYQGSPVYRNSFFTEDMNHADIFLRDSVVPTAGDSEATE